MSKKLEIKCTIDRVVRINGKSDATMVVTIPVAQAIDIPLGRVVMSIDSLQKAMFGQPAEGDMLENGGKITKNKKR